MSLQRQMPIRPTGCLCPRQGNLQAVTKRFKTSVVAACQVDRINIGDRWFHIGLQYWRPQRCTLLELRLLPDVVWGHRVVRPFCLDGPKPRVSPISALQVFRQMELADALEVRLFKLVPFDRRVADWKPDRLLTICPLSDGYGCFRQPHF